MQPRVPVKRESTGCRSISRRTPNCRSSKVLLQAGVLPQAVHTRAAARHSRSELGPSCCALPAVPAPPPGLASCSPSSPATSPLPARASAVSRKAPEPGTENCPSHTPAKGVRCCSNACHNRRALKQKWMQCRRLLGESSRFSGNSLHNKHHLCDRQ